MKSLIVRRQFTNMGDGSESEDGESAIITVGLKNNLSRLKLFINRTAEVRGDLRVQIDLKSLDFNIMSHAFRQTKSQ